MSAKINLSFKDTEEEKELLKWIETKSKIIGKSNYIKQVLYQEMLKEKSE
ncbi:hypothetical protein [Clostridium chrysemydis]|nr:hypothetical protein [Clostridium chrysemydis]